MTKKELLIAFKYGTNYDIDVVERALNVVADEKYKLNLARIECSDNHEFIDYLNARFMSSYNMFVDQFQILGTKLEHAFYDYLENAID